MISSRAALLIMLTLGVSNFSWGTTPRCPPSERKVSKSVAADLEGSGQHMRAVFFSCKLRSSQSEELPEYVFGVSVRHAERPNEEVAEWESTPTTMDAFYPNDNRVLQEPGSTGKLITTSVQYAGKLLTLSMFRFVHGALVPVGEWSGNGVEVRMLGGHLAITIGDPNQVELPKLLVWSDGRFVPAGSRFSKLYSILAEDYRGLIESSQPIEPWFLYTECVLSFKAFWRGGEPERGRAACEAARVRLLQRRALEPYFPSDSGGKFESEINNAVNTISRFLSHPERDFPELSGSTNRSR